MARSPELWAYLNQSGVLEHGTEDDITQAKKEYRKIYQREYKRKRRKERKEVTMFFTHKEYREIVVYAKRCKKRVPTTIKELCLATVRNEYYVPNHQAIAKLEQLLSRMYFEIQQTTPNAELLLEKIDHLETDITSVFRHPPSLTSVISDVLARNPKFLSALKNIITPHVHTNQRQ